MSIDYATATLLAMSVLACGIVIVVRKRGEPGTKRGHADRDPIVSPANWEQLGAALARAASALESASARQPADQNLERARDEAAGALRRWRTVVSPRPSER